jgi:DNA-binding NarL/FixJ family response regulator
MESGCLLCGRRLTPTTRLDVSVWLPVSEDAGGTARTILLHRTCADRLTLAILQSLEARTAQPAARRRVARAGLPLTRRERQVVAHLVDGATNDEIAQRLGVRTATVRNLVSNVMRKLGVRSRTEAAVVALRLGLVR